MDSEALQSVRDANNATQRRFTTEVRKALQAAGHRVGGPQSGRQANLDRAVTLKRFGGDLKAPSCQVAGYAMFEAGDSLTAAGFTVTRMRGSISTGPWLLIRPKPTTKENQ